MTSGPRRAPLRVSEIEMISHIAAPRYTLSHIILRLARSKSFPEGSLRRGYDIRAVLDPAGRLDAQAWRDHPTAFGVQRFWDDERIRHGMLIHRAGGAGGATWAVRYAGQDDNQEDGFRLGDHIMQRDEFVSIHDDDGVMQTFRISEVKATGESLNEVAGT